MRFYYLKAIRIRKRSIIIFILLILLTVAAVKTVTYRLDQKAVQVLSWAVVNKVIVVDPGHGGVDPGSQGQQALEKEITLEVGHRLTKLLSQAGAAVIMTREDDSDLRFSEGRKFTTSKQREDLYNRAQIANKNKADLFISLHVDKIAQAQYSGAATFVHPNASEESFQLAESIQEQLKVTLKNTNRKTQKGDYFVLENCQGPAVLIEMGFISNPKEERNLMDSEYQNKLAWAIYSGIVKYYAQDDQDAINQSEDDILKSFIQMEGDIIEGSP